MFMENRWQINQEDYIHSQIKAVQQQSPIINLTLIVIHNKTSGEEEIIIRRRIVQYAFV